MCVCAHAGLGRYPAPCYGVIRYIVQSLPLILLGATFLVWTSTRALQLLQSRVFHVVPFGSMSPTSLSDTCVGIVISGVYMMYFGQYAKLCIRFVLVQTVACGYSVELSVGCA